MKVIYTEDSQSDIESIYDHIAKEGSPAAADRTIDAIVATCEDLALFPGMGRRRPELDDLGIEVRTIGERNHVIVYAEHDGDLHVVRVLHQSRDLGPHYLESLRDVAS